MCVNLVYAYASQSVFSSSYNVSCLTQGDVMSGCVAAFLSWAVNYGKQTGANQVPKQSAPQCLWFAVV